MLTTPRRRWFQFSLRTMFVALTVAAIFAAFFAGNDMQVIRNRQKAREKLLLLKATFYIEGGNIESITVNPVFNLNPNSTGTISSHRRRLGDKAVLQIIIHDASLLEYAKKNFPEAAITLEPN